MPEPDDERKPDGSQTPLRMVAAFIPSPSQVTGALIDVFGKHSPRWQRMIALFWTALFCFVGLALIAALVLTPNLTDRAAQTIRYIVLFCGTLGFNMLIAAKLVGNAEAISQGKHDTLKAIGEGEARQANNTDLTVRAAVSEAMHDPELVRAIAEAAVRAVQERRVTDGE